jgi:hypothetical protein
VEGVAQYQTILDMVIDKCQSSFWASNQTGSASYLLSYLPIHQHSYQQPVALAVLELQPKGLVSEVADLEPEVVGLESVELAEFAEHYNYKDSDT